MKLRSLVVAALVAGSSMALAAPALAVPDCRSWEPCFQATMTVCHTVAQIKNDPGMCM